MTEVFDYSESFTIALLSSANTIDFFIPDGAELTVSEVV